MKAIGVKIWPGTVVQKAPPKDVDLQEGAKLPGGAWRLDPASRQGPREPNGAWMKTDPDL